ncbi:MAG: cobaltochelatase subunit CobN, partial [Devosia sp.]
MHLLAAQAGALQQEGEAIDLGQTPGRIVFASAADSELSLMAGAVDRAGVSDVRLANVLRLAHNLSVDLWLEQTVQHAEMVVVRLLGGAAYWPYGADQLEALARDRGIRLALLPGDAVPDPSLESRSTVTSEEWRRLHGLFTAGGPENADAVLRMFVQVAELSLPPPLRGGGWPLAQSSGPTPTPAPPLKGEGGESSVPFMPKPFPRFGYWLPGRGVVEEIAVSDRPAVPLLFYRAALEGAGTAPLESLVAQMERRGLAPVPLMISTLKEGACIRFVQRAFATHAPQAILNLTGFALGLDGLDDKLNPFAGCDAPVIQLVQGGRPEAQWAADSQGLSAKDLAMQIVLPELDGRIGGILVGHKAEAVWHAATQCPLSAYAPDEDGISRAVSLAANWVRLRQTSRKDKRVATVLANYPIRDGRLANGVGYDAPESTVRVLRHLEAGGFGLTPAPGPSPQGGGGHRVQFKNERGTKDIERARELRNGTSPPERVMWKLLKSFRNFHFRRQVPIGSYFADFACHHPKLAIELDGHSHGTDTAQARDTRRTTFLESAGYRVLRFWNGDVTTNPQGIWETINAALTELSRPSPLRGGVGGGGWPQTGNDLIELLQAGPTNAHPERGAGVAWPVERYRELFAELPEKVRGEVTGRWGEPEVDPFVRGAAFHLPVVMFGNVAVMLQPARGYDRDETAAYHDPDLVPPHAYLAAYLWMRHEFGAHAVIHNGKHGSLEWLPGKAVALDGASYPAALWGELPHLYPFIVNDPGEGTQAKRRTGAVIIDHLVPPLT